MLNPQALPLRVGVDVGSRCHSVAVGLTDGSLLEEFEIPHTAAGFGDFFARIEGHGLAPSLSDCRGHGRLQWPRPAARQPGQGEGLRLFSVNNLKLARFKEIFPAAAKSDRIDSAKTLELFQLRDHLPMTGDVLQEVMATPEENDILKRVIAAPAPPGQRTSACDQFCIGRSSGRRAGAVGDHPRCRQPLVPELSHPPQRPHKARPDTPREPAQGPRHRNHLRRCHPGLAEVRLLRSRCRPGRRHDPAGRQTDP